MGFLRFAPLFWNPWMFLFPEWYPAPRQAPPRDDPEARK
jgi:hypothetical protein